MSPTRPPANSREADAATAHSVPRRRFVALGAGLGATLLAGCSTDTEPSGGAGDDPASTTADGVTASSGTFRLLISDRPADIGDFDRLDVSFDRARIFRAGGDDAANEEETDDDETEEAETETTETGTEGEETETETQAEETETETEGEETETEGTETGTTENGPETTAEPEDSDDPDDGEKRGFSVVELGGATVDLTQVVGDKAVSVSEIPLEEGRYAKVELYAEGVEGIVDGEPVEVTIPSGKLQIVKPFEVVAGETLSFVFDINVVKKGQSSEYNLLPVIAESGVAGEDVEVEEGTDDSNGTEGTGTDVEETEQGTDESEGEGEEGADAGAEEGDGPPDDETGES